MVELYSTGGCPFSQRVRGVLGHRHVAYDAIEVDPRNPDADFLKLCPTGTAPLLVEKDLKLYEASAICEYVAEARGWTDAFDEKPAVRARERQSMLAWDRRVVPAFLASVGDPASFAAHRRTVQMELQELLRTVHATGKRTDNLLSFWVAPFSACFEAARDRSPIASLIDEWIDLKVWLQHAGSPAAV